MMEKRELQITTELSLEVYIDAQMGLLFTGEQVAKGMGAKEDLIRKHKSNHPDIFIEDKHYTNRLVETAAGNRTASMWTLRGIMRLERFVQTEAALSLGSWAEKVIFDGAELDVLGREDLLRQEAKQQSKVDAQQETVDALEEVIKLKELKKELSKVQKCKRSIDTEAINGMHHLWQQSMKTN